MSSFLFATQPITGHVVPAVPIVRVQAELSGKDAADQAVSLLERPAETRAPVRRA